MNLDTRFTIRQSVLSRLVGDETVILELESGSYFGLDPIGARVWALIGTGTTLGDLCEVMIADYEVDRAQLERDLEALVTDLAHNRLITVKDD
jgi:Coenzyme PQQ synthesis protein D (PqqD)